MCLRQSGCYRVLAELRQEPTQLPEKLEVSAPGELRVTYSDDDVACTYPQNWKAEEKKSKEKILVQINIAPPEAHLANWVTHGLFIGHVLKTADTFPSTLDGAYDQFSAYERQRGLVISEARTQAIGDSHGKLAAYTSPSVFEAGESGWLAVVKDKGAGYYYIQMFYPSNDDASMYARTFTKIRAYGAFVAIYRYLALYKKSLSNARHGILLPNRLG
jgi:hypothetical protein